MITEVYIPPVALAAIAVWVVLSLAGLVALLYAEPMEDLE